MSSLTRWVLAHKRTVVLAWIVLTIAGVMAAGPATDALDPEFSVPNKEGWETNQTIAQHYRGTGGDTMPLVPVVTLPKGTSADSPAVKADLAQVDRKLEKALPGSRLVSYASTGDRAFVSKDGSTTFGLVYPPPDPDSVFGENAKAEKTASAVLKGTTVAGAPVHLTGFDALFEDSGADGDGPGLLLEAVLGGLGAFAVLLFVFASALAIVPILMAVVSIMTTFLLLLGLTELTSVSPIVQFLIALLGLGIAIDYSLIVVSRWREERSHGRSGDEAVQTAMETAGRAVVFSGITVAIGLLALIALPLPFLRSMGYGGMLIPLVSTLVAITLLPVVLAKLGHRPRWAPRPTEGKASRAWTRWAEGVSRRRWVAAGAGMAVIVALAFAATDLQLGTSDADAAAWGVLVLVWQHGYGSEAIWDIQATGSIPSWMPLMVFAFLFGLSMDYEVFILSRMREEYDRTGSTETAVIRGIGRTGRLVTSAALILFLAFTSMASGPETDVKMMATGLAAGILLDATVIRALIVPAIVSLFGRWDWWLPERPARLLRVKPALP